MAENQKHQQPQHQQGNRPDSPKPEIGQQARQARP